MSRILVGYLLLIILVLFLASVIAAKSHQTASTKAQRVITIYSAPSSKAGGDQSAYIVGEAANPQKFLSAFYQAKGRVYLSSMRGIFAERLSNGEMVPVKRIPHGLVFREAGQEIGGTIGKKLPIQTQRVVLGWPNTLWEKLESSVSGSDIAIITYTVDQKNEIHARRVK